MSSSNLLEVNNLSVLFKPQGRVVKAVNDVSFSVCQSEVIGLAGESGSGKSTIGLSLMGFFQKGKKHFNVSGNVTFYGRNRAEISILESNQNALKRFRGSEISMVFQEHGSSLNPVMTCGRQVAEVLMEHRGLSEKEAYDETLLWLTKVGFQNSRQIFSSFPHQLSGGQKQRVLIALAVCCRPRLLIADEPTSSLDAIHQNEIIRLLANLQSEFRMSMIFISHDISLLAALSQRIMILHKGMIVEQGTVNDILKHPKHTATRSLTDHFYRVAFNVQTEVKTKPGPDEKESVTEHPGTGPEQVNPDNKSNESPDQITGNKVLLKVANLSAWYPVRKRIFSLRHETTRVVSDVSFELFPGETLGLVGISGCGKSTLSKSILRLLETVSGTVVFNGKELLHLENRQMRQVRSQLQVVFQDPYSSLNPRMTVGSILTEPMRRFALYESDSRRKTKAMELLESVLLHEEYFDRFPHQLSGGQRQRVAIARALAVEPQLIICDEAVSSLDAPTQDQVLNLFRQLKARFGFSMLFISHNMSVIRAVSDRIAVMHEGIFVESGTASEVLLKPKHEITKKLLEASKPSVN